MTTTMQRSRTPLLVMAAAIAGAATVAIVKGSSPPATKEPETAVAPPLPSGMAGPLPEGHAEMGELPPGHPPINGLPAGHPPIGDGPTAANAPATETAIAWTAPPRWQSVPHASAMRIATYKIPKVEGDSADPELSVIRAGGDAQANATRWIGQFDEASRKGARTTSKTVAGLPVTVVEVEGDYAGMGDQASKGWALLAAIVETGGGESHFFKMTGPEKSVKAARAEFDALIGSLKAK
jgi:hypothetical protein